MRHLIDKLINDLIYATVTDTTTLHFNHMYSTPRHLSRLYFNDRHIISLILFYWLESTVRLLAFAIMFGIVLAYNTPEAMIKTTETTILIACYKINCKHAHY